MSQLLDWPDRPDRRAVLDLGASAQRMAHDPPLFQAFLGPPKPRPGAPHGPGKGIMEGVPSS